MTAPAPRPVRRVFDVAATSWRNGGGSTRELLAWPDSAGWRVRVSVADVERDGPFSAFPGVQRWFTVLQGAGVELTVAGHTHRLTRNSPPLCFDGALATACKLIDGPTRDLNLMLRGASGLVRIAEDGLAWQPAAAQCGLLTAVSGRCRSAGGEVDLPPYALLWFDAAPENLVFTATQRPAAAAGWWLAASPWQEH